MSLDYYEERMCGIWALIGNLMDSTTVKHCIKQIAARGPEAARVVEGERFQLGFTRLSINGLNPMGMQPMTHDNGHWQWICNGEIYNWRNLASRYSIETESGSDCEIIGKLFPRLASETDARTFFRSLDGVFSIVMIDSDSGIAYVARDPYGVRPLFVGYVLGNPVDDAGNNAVVLDSSGNKRVVERIVFASELKAMPLAECSIVEPFPPGHYAAYDLKTLGRIGFEAYHTVPFLKNPTLEDEKCASNALSTALELAVKKRMMTQRPVAALLSGGLDSSLIAALVQRELKTAGAPPLKTFSIGFEGSKDLYYAQMVANHIGSEHHEIVMTPADFLDAIPAVIRDIESYDITSVRASVGNWLVSREIRRRTDCKVVFNGDGSDEVFGGYLYFYKAPGDEAFEAESERLLQDIHMYDVLRSDRSISSHGLEARTPFLDKQFVAVARSISSKLRRPVKDAQCEKYILRKAFDGSGLLPDEVLWRTKTAFSDGVSGEKSWYEICQEYAIQEVDDNWQEKANVFRHLTPKTAEAYYYRALFNKYYKNAETCIPYFWMPKWSPETNDPSALTLKY